jgi:Fe-S-cluster containining protein
MRYALGVRSKYPKAADDKLIQIVDAALADATLRGGKWIVCRPGCTQCCIGVFAINQLDALRLQQGMAILASNDSERARAVRERARESMSRLASEFPGNLTTGILDDSESGVERFEAFANDEPCPALDPMTGRCELYESRPMTCRVFGPPVRSEGGLGVCELNFQGASEEEIAACEMIPDPDELEPRVVKKVETETGRQGNTIIAFALAK